jgi:hypothetical protein
LMTTGRRIPSNCCTAASAHNLEYIQEYKAQITVSATACNDHNSKPYVE